MTVASNPSQIGLFLVTEDSPHPLGAEQWVPPHEARTIDEAKRIATMLHRRRPHCTLTVSFQPLDGRLLAIETLDQDGWHQAT